MCPFLLLYLRGVRFPLQDVEGRQALLLGTTPGAVPEVSSMQYIGIPAGGRPAGICYLVHMITIPSVALTSAVLPALAGSNPPKQRLCTIRTECMHTFIILF